MKLIVGVEFRNRDIQDLQTGSNRAVAAARLDQNRGPGGERVDLIVEFDVSFAFKNVIHLGGFGVEVLLAILLDFNKMHRGDFIFVVHEGTPRLAAGAGRGLDFRKPGDLKILFDHFLFHVIVYACREGFEREAFELFRRLNFPFLSTMSTFKTCLIVPALFCLLLIWTGCEKGDETSVEPAPEATMPVNTIPLPESGQRQLTAEEQRVVVDQLMQARAKQQAQGLGGGSVRVNGAWNYNGYSYLSPDPNAAIEARLVAVDVTISGHTAHFDIDDIEIVDGASLMSYGSDPHPTPLSLDGEILPAGQFPEAAPKANRWLLIYAYPMQSPAFHLYYWGKALTNEPVTLQERGMELPFPPKEGPVE